MRATLQVLVLLLLCLAGSEVSSSRAATPEEQRIERVLAAVEKFENTFRATTNLTDSAVAAADLSIALDRELPEQLANSLAWGLADFYYGYGGLWGFQRYTEALPLSRKTAIRGVMGEKLQAQLKEADQVVASRKAIPLSLQDSKNGWATDKRGATGRQLPGDFIDLRRVRIRALTEGNSGALLDLAYAAYQGHNTPADIDLSHLWSACAKRIDPVLRKQLATLDSKGVETLRVQAEAGCMWAMLELAKKLLPTGFTPIRPGEALTWMQKAVALGYPEADRWIKLRGLADAESYAERINRVLAAVAVFEKDFRSCTNLADTGTAAAELARACERDLPSNISEKLVMGMADYYYANGGVYGYRHFTKGVSAGLIGSINLNLPNERVGMLIKAGEFEKTGQTSDSNWAAKVAGWPTSKRGETGKQAEGEWIDLRRARTRAVVAGDYGALLDLAYASTQGMNVPKDDDLFDFWCNVAYRVNPAWHKQIQAVPAGSSESLRLMAEAGSAIIMTQYADSLNKANSSSTPVPTARQWYEKAAALGHLGAARVLGSNAQVTATAKPKEAPTSNTTMVATKAKPEATGSRATQVAEPKISPGWAARDLESQRSLGSLKFLRDILELERGKALTDQELAGYKKAWEALAGIKSMAQKKTAQGEIYSLLLFSHAAKGMLQREDIAANVKAAQTSLYAFPLPKETDTEPLVRLAEETLAQVAWATRTNFPERTMVAVYLMAAERSRFDELCPQVKLPTGVRFFSYRRTVQQFKESVDLLEDFRAEKSDGNGPRINLPEGLKAAKSWPDWSELSRAAENGNVPDVIHYLNQLAMSLRAVALQRDPTSYPPPVAPALEQLLITPALIRTAKP